MIVFFRPNILKSEASTFKHMYTSMYILHILADNQCQIDSSTHHHALYT